MCFPRSALALVRMDATTLLRRAVEHMEILVRAVAVSNRKLVFVWCRRGAAAFAQQW